MMNFLTEQIEGEIINIENNRIQNRFRGFYKKNKTVIANR